MTVALVALVGTLAVPAHVRAQEIAPIEITASPPATTTTPTPMHSLGPLTSDEAAAALETPRPRRRSGMFTAGAILFSISYTPLFIAGIATAPAGLLAAIPVIGPAAEGVMVLASSGTSLFGGALVAIGLLAIVDSLAQLSGFALMVTGAGRFRDDSTSPRPGAPRSRVAWAIGPGPSRAPLGASVSVSF